MSIGGQPAFEPNFPNPEEQAEALLEICEGDIREAQIIAATNLRFASDTEERRYWSSVEALILKRDPSRAISAAFDEGTE